jgi:hypothetical protein
VGGARSTRRSSPVFVGPSIASPPIDVRDALTSTVAFQVELGPLQGGQLAAAHPGVEASAQQRIPPRVPVRFQ